MNLEDRYAADVFQKSYREYLALQPTHYRWSRLAPQSIEWLEQARLQHWSMEKLSDYLHCPVPEAEACYRRYCVSRKVNEKEGTAARMRQAFVEWTAGTGVTDEKAQRAMADELALIVANHLHASALAKEDVLELSRKLESPAPEEGRPGAGGKAGGEERTWGPQWKE